MNYLESLAYLESLSPTLLAPCLERVEAFMEECGRLQDSFMSLHVGGTNGKGSTVAILDSVLRRAGMKVGRYTGPHLLRWNERFHVDGTPITDDRFAELATRLRAESEDFGRRRPEFGSLTWFEFLTVLAFTYFAENEVDIAVLEVGLGGRWDATNVVAAPLATAITNVDLDHTQILGETVAEIAREKAGIIKKGRPVVTAATGEALSQILAAAAACAAPVYQCVPPETISLIANEYSMKEQLLAARSSLSLAGSHQQLNLLVAIGTLLASGLTPGSAGVPPALSLGARASCPLLPALAAGAGKMPALPGSALADWHDIVADGLESVYWPGRMQYLDGMDLVLDGAHNPAGARALRSALDELFPEKKFLFVIGCFQNKDVPTYIRALIRPDDRVIATEASSRRAVFPVDQIMDIAASENIEASAAASVGESLARALDQRRQDETVVVTGSFATVREVMLALGWQTVEDGLASTRMDWLQAACQGTKSK